MQLLFVWVRKYSLLEKQLFNFSNDYRFKVEENNSERNMILHIEKNFDHVPGLWSESIVSISGIFGRNGSGKTTILDFISSNLPNGAGNLCDGCIIGVRQDNKNIVWNTDKDAKWNYVISPDAGAFEKYEVGANYSSEVTGLARRNTSIIYYTPGHWPLENLRELAGPYSNEHGFHNISTSFLLQHDAISFANSEHPVEGKAPGPTQLLAHRFQSWRREMAFLSSKHADELGFQVPKHVLVSVNEFEEKRLSKDTKMLSLLKPFGLGQKPENQQDHIRGFKDNLYRAMIYNLFYTTREPSSSLGVPTPPVIRGASILELCRNLLKPISLNSKNAYSNTAHAMLDFIEYIESADESFLEMPSSSGARISINLGESNKLADFFQKYSPTIIITDYLLFSWDYRLSSGEQSLLTLYARLWMLAKKSDMPNRDPARNVNLRKDVILLLDEADSYFHPKWQRQLFKRLVEFVPKIYVGCKVQIIIAANNPYQLSDMFRYQTIFLNEKGRVIPDPETLPQTFAGNIHYLLADSFFMGDCLIGDFASDKIKILATWLGVDGEKSKPPKWLTAETAATLIEQIGEPILRDKLREMLAYRFPERFRIIMLKKRLGEIELRRDELSKELHALE